MNKEIIINKGLPYSDNLKMIPTDRNCTCPDKKEVFEKLVKFYLFATLATTDYDADYFNFIYRNLDMMYEYDTILQENEKRLVEQLLNNDSDVDRNRLSWLYEYCFILLWMLNICAFPSSERENNADILNDWLFIRSDDVAKKNLPSKLYGELYNSETKKIDLDKINMKSFTEILEKADLVKRYLWALEELRISNGENKYGLDEYIVRYQVNIFSSILKWDLTNPGL